MNSSGLMGKVSVGCWALAGAWGWDGAAIAQIVPDGSLGGERSVVFAAPTNDFINGGAQRGQNLFHSFQEFNVVPGRSAYFLVPNTTIQNVLARVTGNNPSNISGTLGTIRQLPNGQFSTAVPNVNLFLINPNGISFGPGARLNIGGSFLGTTASGVGFSGMGEFGVTNPQAPGPLLTIAPSVLLLNQTNPGSISTDQARLIVPAGKNLRLLGGDISIQGPGGLATFGGRIELVAIAAPAAVGFAPNANLTVPAGVERGPIGLKDGARIDVLDENIKGGSINLIGKDIVLLNRSVLFAGVYQGFGSPDRQAGNITVDATGDLILQQSAVRNWVQAGAIGNSGNIDINARKLFVVEGGSLSTEVFGRGNAGNINITTDRTFADGNSSEITSSISTSNAVGRAGNIFINTGFLGITNGANVYTATLGVGNAGDVNIIANDINLDTGVAVRGLRGIGSIVEDTATGNGGSISIKTDGLAAFNGARVFSQIYGTGNAGDVVIKANGDIFLSGTTSNPNSTQSISSGITNEVGAFGEGQGGGVFIAANNLYASGGASVSTSTFGNGSSGNIDVVANNIFLDSTGVGGRPASGIFSAVADEEAIGAGGDINIAAKKIVIADGAAISTGTVGRGNAGNIGITADGIFLTGTSLNGTPSQIITEVKTSGKGNGGNISIKTLRLTGIDGASISAATAGKGNAGNVNIEASRIRLSGRLPSGSGTRILSAVLSGAKGSGGDINIKADSFSLFDGALLSASSLGEGDAGNIDLKANIIRLSRSDVLSIAFTGNGANIRISSDALILRRSSLVSATAGIDGAGGNGGNITLNSKFVIAAFKENSDIGANAFQGKGGQISINTQGLFGIVPLPRSNNTLSDITASSELGIQGTIAITQPDVRPEQGLIELPINPTDPSKKIAQECRQAQGVGNFVVTGRGSLPPNPIDDFGGTPVIAPLASIETNSQTAILAPPALPIAEAQSWLRNEDGQVRLVVLTPRRATDRLSTRSSCPGRQN
jgi:filamentous hemagglutinin family protein